MLSPIQTGAGAGHLELKALTKRYDDLHAVAGVSLDIRPGELVALLGPSGCGKSTLLRCVAGLITPTSGDIFIDGKSIVDRPVHKRGLGMVFQSYALFPHMSVRENIAFGLKMRRIPRAEIDTAVDAALAQVQMEPFGRRMPSELSGGQQQRVALARAIVTKPSVLLLDEPFSALDAKLRQAMQLEVRQLQKRLNITTLFVTHDQEEAMVTADRVAVVRNGKIEQFDSPAESYNRPRSLFVADFIGRMNHIQGILDAHAAGHSTVRSEYGAILLFAQFSNELQPGTPVVGLIRPERMNIFRETPGALPPENYVAGTVRDITFIGEKLAVLVDSSCGLLFVHLPNAGNNHASLSAGDHVKLHWDPADMLLFPLA